MMLTNYPFDSALVAERQRERLDHIERMPRPRRSRGPRHSRRSMSRWSFAGWLFGPSRQGGGAAAT